jgi:hypothetical protein
MSTTKKTTKPKQIPDAYQFTGEDLNWYWDNFEKCCGPNGPSPKATKKELDFFNLVDEAHRVSSILKHLPTMGELRLHWQSEREEQERRRLASWRPDYRFTAKDLSEYEMLLAREESGPFMNFMSVVAHLKQSTGNFPTVAEVRVYCDANQKAV